jgi:outer membrane lipoprotein-sorting protein
VKSVTGRIAFLFLSLLLLLSFTGSRKVEGTASEDGNSSRAGSPSDALTTLVQNITTAYGGKKAVENVKSVYASGKIRALAFNDRGKYVRYFKRPGKLRVDIRYTRSSELRILNGNRAYESIDGSPLSPVAGDRSVAMEYQYRQLDLPYGLLRNPREITYEGKADVNGVEVEVLGMKGAEGPPMKIYIDGKTFHIVRVSGYFSVGNATMALSAEFADFKKVDGTMFPFKITNFADGQEIAETSLEDYRVNPEMSDSLFSPSTN